MRAMEGVSSSAQDLLSGVQSVATGCYHSLRGVLPVFYLVQDNPKIRRQLLQCFLLNGVILCLGILTFDYVFLPTVEYLAGRIYGLVISSPVTESHLLHWLATFLQYLFTGLWVLPVFWISKPINVIWFQDIASAALTESQKKTEGGKKTEGEREIKKTKSQQSSSGQSVSQSISRFIADLLFSVLLQLLFLLQAMVVRLIPGVGWLLSLLHMTILYSLYCFEYKWMHDGLPVHQRITQLESRWPYFIGFGLPLAVLASLSGSLVISASLFAVSFPLFIISATSATPTSSRLPALPIFNIVINITNKLVTKTSSQSRGLRATKTSSPSRGQHHGTRVTPYGTHY